MEDIFLRYCAFGAGQRGDNLMDNSRFGKFCRESGILGPNCNKRDADIIFVRVASATRRRKITYPEFINVLERIALRKRVPFTLLEATILQSGGPRLHAAATVPDAVKFHDQKHLYTGTFIHGGPTSNDLHTFMMDAALLPRSSHDVRGCEASLAQRQNHPFHSSWDNRRQISSPSYDGSYTDNVVPTSSGNGQTVAYNANHIPKAARDAYNSLYSPYLPKFGPAAGQQ